jgi:hypothetical protein
VFFNLGFTRFLSLTNTISILLLQSELSLKFKFGVTAYYGIIIFGPRKDIIM